MIIHFNSMGMMEVAFGSDHPSTSSRIVINGGQLDLAHELGVIPLSICQRSRAGDTSRQRLGESDDCSIFPYPFIAVEVRGRACVVWESGIMSYVSPAEYVGNVDTAVQLTQQKSSLLDQLLSNIWKMYE